MNFAVKLLNLATLAFLIVGGLNWGLMGLFQFDAVATILGGQQMSSTRIIYLLVGAAAIWQLAPFIRATGTKEHLSEGGR